jgi:hypothetical protein
MFLVVLFYCVAAESHQHDSILLFLLQNIVKFCIRLLVFHSLTENGKPNSEK